MSVSVAFGLPAYNKAPTPNPLPPEPEFREAEPIDGSLVWISIPKPDKIHLNGPLFLNQFKPSANFQIEELGQKLMSRLASSALEPPIATKYVETTGTYTRVQRCFGSAKAPVFFEIKYAKKDDPAKHRLHMQFNPTRLGEEGHFELLDFFQKALGDIFCVGEFLAEARLSRIDAALDLVGMHIDDLLVRSNAGGISNFVVSDEGDLQSISIHRKNKKHEDGSLTATGKSKPMGDLLVRAYDKRAERIARGHPPRFGQAHHIRVEAQKTRFGPKPQLLSSIFELNDPFKGIKLASIQKTGAGMGGQWIRYAHLRKIIGEAQARSICNLSEQDADRFEEAYWLSEKIEGSEVNWIFWDDGIISTGLHYLVECAEQKSFGVPLPG